MKVSLTENEEKITGEIKGTGFLTVGVIGKAISKILCTAILAQLSIHFENIWVMLFLFLI